MAPELPSSLGGTHRQVALAFVQWKMEVLRVWGQGDGPVRGA